VNGETAGALFFLFKEIRAIFPLRTLNPPAVFKGGKRPVGKVPSVSNQSLVSREK
jgi:hypothetical protein